MFCTRMSLCCGVDDDDKVTCEADVVRCRANCAAGTASAISLELAGRGGCDCCAVGAQYTFGACTTFLGEPSDDVVVVLVGFEMTLSWRFAS